MHASGRLRKSDRGPAGKRVPRGGLRLVWRRAGLFLVNPVNPVDPVRGDCAESRRPAEVPLRARACFPWREPAGYVSLRDEDDEEVALVRDLGELDPASREAVERALAESGFVMEIVRVKSVEEEFEVRHWTVETAGGPRSFQTKRDEWPREMPGGGLLIRDVAGDLYRVADLEALDRASRELLRPFAG